MIDTDTLRVIRKAHIDLEKWPTRVEGFYKSKDDYHKILQEHITRLSNLQSRLYADNRYSILMIFQAMDAAGKDGAIKHVMSGVNPQGCQVVSFKHPEPSELDHDFLWRTTRSLPERGKIGIFNRSYYEEVLIVRVHPELLTSERLPDLAAKPDRIWEQRYRSIRDLERHLYLNGTRILKFFLHISKEEQRKRFIARIEDPDKNWKFSKSDITERQYWSEYMKVYEICLRKTSTKKSPWFIIPADDKETARLIISEIILKNLEKLKLTYPVTSPDEKARLLLLRSQLEMDTQ